MRDMLTGVVIRRNRRDTAQPAMWPWAVVSVALVICVALGLLLARAAFQHAQRPTVVAAPTLPPMNAIAVAHPEAGASLYALDASLGHLVALAAPRELMCPPTGTCPAAPAPDSFVVVDGQTGKNLASSALTGDAAPASDARVLLVDPARHLAYAIAPEGVIVFSTQTAARVGGFALPSEVAGEVGAALDGQTLYVTNGAQVFLIDAASGQVAASADLPGGSTGGALDGPIVDDARARIYLLHAATAQDAPALFALDAHDLQVLGQYTLPAGTRLGPMDTAGANLYAFGLDGTTWWLPLDTLASGSSGLAPLTAAPALQNALAVGENRSLGHQYVADAGGARVLAASGALAALPLPARGASSQPLLVDDAHGLVYLPADHGALVIVRDGGPAAKAKVPLSATSAVILARAAFAATFHDVEPANGPAFASAAMVPVQPGARPQNFWLVGPNGGWLGPYTGQAATAVARSPRSGSYRVTFTISWIQLFPHQHVWTWDVAPDGASSLVGDTGDPVP